MKELVEVIASALVDNPEEVEVTETEDENQIVLSLKVAPDDMGKVIGSREELQRQFVPLCVQLAQRATKNHGRHSMMSSKPCRKNYRVILNGGLHGRYAANWRGDYNARPAGRS